MNVDIFVFLQESGRDIGCNFFFDSFLENCGFVLFLVQQEDFVGFYNGLNFYSDGLVGNIFFLVEVFGSILVGQGIKVYYVGNRGFLGVWFIEFDMFCLFYIQKLDINVFVVFYFMFVFFVIGFYIVYFKGVIWNVDVFFLDVNVVEQMFIYEVYVVLLGIGLYRIVFIQVESDDIFEVQVFFFVYVY